jgi:hypothetical protein
MGSKDSFLKAMVEDFNETGHLQDPDVEEAPYSVDKEKALQGLAKRKKPAGRTARNVTEERRRQVWRLKQQGMSESEMSVILDVRPVTIRKDLHMIDQALKNGVIDFDNDLFVGDTLQLYAELERQALQEMAVADEGSKERKQFLDQIGKFRKSRIDLLQDTGKLSKKRPGTPIAPGSNTINIGKVSVNEWGLEAQQTVVKALLQGEVGVGEEPELDPDFIIDAPVEEDNA